MKTKKIISIKFDDGTERLADDDDLRRYLELRDIERLTEQAFWSFKPWELRSLFDALQAVWLGEQSETNRNNAAGPRKSATKAELEKIRDAFERDKGDLRGWKKKACHDLGITQKTLKKRMEE